MRRIKMVDYKIIEQIKADANWGGKRPGSGRPRSKVELRVGDIITIEGELEEPFDVTVARFEGNGFVGTTELKDGGIYELRFTINPPEPNKTD